MSEISKSKICTKIVPLAVIIFIINLVLLLILYDILTKDFGLYGSYILFAIISTSLIYIIFYILGFIDLSKCKLGFNTLQKSAVIFIIGTIITFSLYFILVNCSKLQAKRHGLGIRQVNLVLIISRINESQNVTKYLNKNYSRKISNLKYLHLNATPLGGDRYKLFERAEILALDKPNKSNYEFILFDEKAPLPFIVSLTPNTISIIEFNNYNEIVFDGNAPAYKRKHILFYNNDDLNQHWKTVIYENGVIQKEIIEKNDTWELNIYKNNSIKTKMYGWKYRLGLREILNELYLGWSH